MSSTHCSFSERIINELNRAVCGDTSLTSFEIIPMPSSQNRNSSPVVRGGSTLGIESWVIRHILPYANNMILKGNPQSDAEKQAPMLLTLNLLHPELPTAWNRRRNLILRRKLSCSNELRLARLALTQQPKCNEALAHRRWVICHNSVPGEEMNTLQQELSLVNLIADRYHSNYHAWTHRQWIMRRLAPVKSRENTPSSIPKTISKRMLCNIFASSHLAIYVNELESNFQFISTHVSDYSSMHYRQFLLSSIIEILSNEANADDSENRDCDGELAKHALLFYASVKPEIREFLQNDHGASAYLSNLEHNLTLFDIIISVFLNELKMNISLSLLYVDHEALWCYRRFLIQFVINFLNESQSSFNHIQVKCKTHVELNFDEIKSNLLKVLLSNEEAHIKSLNSSRIRSLEKYAVWLQRQNILRAN